MKKICIIEGCGKKHLAKGLCSTHYGQTPGRKASIKAYSQTSKSRAYQKAHRQTPECKAYQKIYRQAHEYKTYQKAYHHTRLRTDPPYRFSLNVRRLIRHSFKNGGCSKNTKTEKLLGCSFEEARAHVGWFPGCEVHHIIPLATGKTKEDIERLSHHTNLIALTIPEHAAVHAGIFELIPRNRAIPQILIAA